MLTVGDCHRIHRMQLHRHGHRQLCHQGLRSDASPAKAQQSTEGTTPENHGRSDKQAEEHVLREQAPSELTEQELTKWPSLITQACFQSMDKVAGQQGFLTLLEEEKPKLSGATKASDIFKKMPGFLSQLKSAHDVAAAIKVKVESVTPELVIKT